MKYIQGQSRTQTSLFPISLDDTINPEHEVRLIDVFVDSLDLEKFGFEVEQQCVDKWKDIDKELLEIVKRQTYGED